MVKRLSHSLLPENDSFGSRLLWVPPQYRTVDLHLVLMIFETSVLMHFSYALKFFFFFNFISKMVLFSVLMWNDPCVFVKPLDSLRDITIIKTRTVTPYL